MRRDTAYAELRAAANNLTRRLRGSPAQDVLERATARQQDMTAEAALAYTRWAALDSGSALGSGSAGLGHALDMSGVTNLLGGIQSVCSMGSGPLSAVLGDLEQLRSRGAIMRRVRTSLQEAEYDRTSDSAYVTVSPPVIPAIRIRLDRTAQEEPGDNFSDVESHMALQAALN
jgi:hypothetical protein